MVPPNVSVSSSASHPVSSNESPKASAPSSSMIDQPLSPPLSSLSLSRRIDPVALLLPSQHFPSNTTPVTVVTPSTRSLMDDTTVAAEATTAASSTCHPPRSYRFQPPTYVFNTKQSNHLDQLKGSAGCNCKKSRCLKLYCQCFTASTTCGSKCRCDECYNTTEHSVEIDSARRNILLRNPIAFHKAKILLFQQHHEERHPHMPPTMYPNNAHFAQYPSQLPQHPPPHPYSPYNPYSMMRSRNGTHHIPDHYHSRALQHQPSLMFRQPLPTPQCSTINRNYHSTSTFMSSQQPQQPQQPATNQFYTTPRYGEKQTFRRPYNVEVSPETHSHSMTTVVSAPVVVETRQLQSSSQPLPTRVQSVQDGCNCRRTNCLKKYCECFQQSIYCSGTCTCMDCRNYPGALQQKKSTGVNDDKENCRTLPSRIPTSAIRSIHCSSSRSIKLNYRPEPTMPITPPIGNTMGADSQIVRASTIHVPTKDVYNTKILTKRSFQSSLQSSVAKTNVHVDSRREVSATSYPSPLPTTPHTDQDGIKNSTSTVRPSEGDSPRCVVHEPSNSLPITATNVAADDAMIQAAMAMTELLNGMPSIPLVIINDDFDHNVRGKEQNDELMSSDLRPIKKPKVQLNNTTMERPEPSEVRSTTNDYTHHSHTGVNYDTCSSSPLQQATPHHPWTPQFLHSSRHSTPQLRLPHPMLPQQDQKLTTHHHHRSLPIVSRRHLIATAYSSSSNSSNEYIGSNDSNNDSPVSSTINAANLYETITLTSGLPKSLSFRKICSRCGRTRSEHGETGFGNACSFEKCGRCGATAQCHQRVGQTMGVLCQMTVNDGATPGASTIYHRKLRDLAARAELLQQNMNRHKRIIVNGQ